MVLSLRHHAGVRLAFPWIHLVSLTMMSFPCTVPLNEKLVFWVSSSFQQGSQRAAFLLELGLQCIRMFFPGVCTVSRGRGTLMTLGKGCSATKAGRVFGRTEQILPVTSSVVRGETWPSGLTWRAGETWWQEPMSLATHVPGYSSFGLDQSTSAI